jgi:Ca-activated chloride channel family protein
MRNALNSLRPNDYFRIVNFNNEVYELTNGALRPTRRNISRGLSFINSLEADGGTEIVLAVEKAFSSPRIHNTVRMVVFLTDGYIGGESEVLRLIKKEIKDSRLYAFGVGTGVNRYLLSEMGRIGRGFARYIDPTEDSEQVAIKLAKKLESPVLTDISIDWKNLKVSEVTPEIIPDLFSGDSIRIQGKFEGEGLETIQVKGNVRGRKSSLPLQLNLSKNNQTEELDSAIPVIWARSKISDYMRQINTAQINKENNSTNDVLKFKVTTLGLNHSLATKWTSFVAVSRRVVNTEPEVTIDATVPLPMVKGTTHKAYPQPLKKGSHSAAYPRTASLLGKSQSIKVNTNIITAQMLAGNSTPEPATVMGMATVCTAGLIVIWFMRRKQYVRDQLET